MRHVLLLSAVVLAVVSVGVLLAALVTSWSRDHRRQLIEKGLVSDVARHPPRSARVRRALLLELADRFTGASLAHHAPWLPEVADAARRDLSSRRWIYRARALRTLQSLGLEDREISAGLADSDYRVRALAATLATDRASEELLARLVTLLDDRAPAVRNAALDALTRRAAHSTPALQSALAASPVLEVAQLSQEDGISRQADELARRAVLEDPRSLEELPPDLAARTLPVGSGVVAVTLPSGTAPGTSETLPRPLRATTNVAVQTRTLGLLLRAVGASAESHLVSSVRPFLGDARPEIRAAAVATLAALGEEPALFVLAMKDVDGRVRAEAATALGRLGARSQAGAVACQLSDRDHGVRLAAAGALMRMGAGGTLILRQALTGNDPFAADAARVALKLTPESG